MKIASAELDPIGRVPDSIYSVWFRYPSGFISRGSSLPAFDCIQLEKQTRLIDLYSEDDKFFSARSSVTSYHANSSS